MLKTPILKFEPHNITTILLGLQWLIYILLGAHHFYRMPIRGPVIVTQSPCNVHLPNCHHEFLTHLTNYRPLAHFLLVETLA